jgi:hypothetical protein
MIHRWSRPQTLENIRPILSNSIPGDSYMSQYHNILSTTRKLGGKVSKNGTILIQSTLSTVISKNRDWVSFRISIEQTKHKEYFKSFKFLIDRIKSITQKKYDKPVMWDNFHESGNTITINGKILPGCTLYDNVGNKQEIDNTLKNSIVDFIFAVSQVQIVSPFDDLEKLYGKILIKIVQIRRHNVEVLPIEKYSFETIEKNKNTEDKNIEDKKPKEYAKYFSMLKMGVPRKAVEQRMISDGIDIGVLDGKVIKNKPPAINKFSAQDLKTITLKKTTPKEKPKKPRKGIQLGISLDSIQNALRGLRKTNLLSSFSFD